MKLSTSFLIIGALQFSLIIFSGQYVENGVGSIPLASFFNPTDFSSMLLWTVIAGLVAAIALAGSYIGSFIINKPDLVVFGGLMALFVGWLTPIVSLWRIINVEGFGAAQTAVVVGGGFSITPGQLVGAIIIFPIIMMAFFSMLTWWRSTFEG